MIFNVDYYNPMDRKYNNESLNEAGLGIKDIGMSVPLGISASDVSGINAKIRSGAGSIEIQFAGAGRGQRQAQSPEMWGKEQREALEEMSRINEVKLTTHSTFQIGGLAGQDQQGNFNDEHRKFAVDEIKRAIEFAADTAKGGSVVVHGGEFTRPISEEPWAYHGHVFRSFEEEPEKAVIRVVDDRTGRAIQEVRKNQRIAVSVWNRAENDYEGIFQEGNFNELCGDKTIVKKGDYVDYEGNKIIDPLDVEHGRMPAYDPATGRIKVELKGWDFFVKEAEEWNRLDNEKRAKTGLAPISEYEKVTPEERYLRATLETNEGYSRGWALQFSIGIKQNVENIKKIKKMLKYYEELESNIPDDEKWKIQKQIGSLMGDPYARELIPPETKNPTEILKKALWDEERNLAYHQQSAESQEKQAMDSRETQNHIKSAGKYALGKSFTSYAEAAMYAMEETKKKNLNDNPLMITVENIFPEQYGGHPEELKSLVNGSRERMAEMLKQRGINENEAKKIAATHIKATLDTGHLNTWRKYYKGNDDEFRKWMLSEVEDLAKKKLIGNVHLSDNYGYQDDHLAPGQGNAPVKEIVQILKKHGYKGAFTVEPGADASTDLSDFHGLMKTWRYFGSPIYGIAAPTRFGSRSWGDVQYSYFGRTYPPYFIFGAYSPSNDWTLWSQVPME